MRVNPLSELAGCCAGPQPPAAPARLLVVDQKAATCRSSTFANGKGGDEVGSVAGKRVPPRARRIVSPHRQPQPARTFELWCPPYSLAERQSLSKISAHPHDVPGLGRFLFMECMCCKRASSKMGLSVECLPNLTVLSLI